MLGLLRHLRTARTLRALAGRALALRLAPLRQALLRVGTRTGTLLRATGAAGTLGPAVLRLLAATGAGAALRGGTRTTRAGPALGGLTGLLLTALLLAGLLLAGLGLAGLGLAGLGPGAATRQTARTGTA
ncbi:hypothetical protein ACWEQL_42475, partial [Kitasatospora sp. NPDC004240]